MATVPNVMHPAASLFVSTAGRDMDSEERENMFRSTGEASERMTL